MTWDMQAPIEADLHDLHENELEYAGCCGERLTFSIMSFMKMS